MHASPTMNLMREIQAAQASAVLAYVEDPRDNKLKIELRTNNEPAIPTDAIRELTDSPRLEPSCTPESRWQLGGRGPSFNNYVSTVFVLKENSKVVVLWNIAEQE